MMKNIKQMPLVLVLLASVVALFSSCNFRMTSKQENLYIGFISNLERLAGKRELTKEDVERELDPVNISAKRLGFRIEDKNPNTPIAQGTKADKLKKRFVPKEK